MKKRATITTEQQVEELKTELSKNFHLAIISAPCSKEEHIKDLCELYDHLQMIYHS